MLPPPPPPPHTHTPNREWCCCLLLFSCKAEVRTRLLTQKVQGHMETVTDCFAHVFKFETGASACPNEPALSVASRLTQRGRRCSLSTNFLRVQQ